ncbi:MAG: phosphomannomutase/phosphoglucomutase [Kiritimatiellia bacterium]
MLKYAALLRCFHRDIPREVNPMGFFKAYDMRGTFGTDFDLETVGKIGLALPQVVGGRRWLVGRDCRVTSPAVRDALLRGLAAAGAEVTDLGLCTTPMVYFFTAQDGYDGSVMVTASHNPPSDNGLKVSKRSALPVGYADGLDEVERLVTAGGPELARHGEAGTASPTAAGDALARYLDWMRLRQPPTLGDLRFAVDCSNGMSSLLVHKLFPGAVVINDRLDGTFPAHSPNPLKAEAREQLAALVRERRLDCGVIFDGDADRCMFVDERGEFVQPDYLIPVVARATLRHAPFSDRPTPKIIHDVRTSRGAIEELRRMGCEPVMVPVGHAFAKPIIRATSAVCGGELAGHYYFSEFFGCDSGVLAALRILGEIARAKADGRTFSALMRPIGGVYANSGELNFRVEDKDAAIGRVLAAAKAELPAELSRSEMDGVRIEYEDGWINIRKSNTEPYLRLIAERRGDVGEWVRILRAAIG